MVKTATLAAILLIVILGLGYWAVNRSERESNSLATEEQTGSTANPDQEEDAVLKESTEQDDESVTPALAVTYTDSGYSPTSLNIKAGETVVFVNESSRSMWTASDPHPVHTDFSAFDARKGYSSGQSYTFTFDKAGTYKYHNHLRSSDSGQIVVE